MIRRLSLAVLVLAVPALAWSADEPDWVAKVPDFRSAWPEPPAAGTAAPAFSLTDVATGKTVTLAKARAGRKATLVLFVDENCGTCKRRGADLAATLNRVSNIESAGAIAVFTRNLIDRGADGILAFAKTAGFPEGVPLLDDDEGDRAEVTLSYRVTVAPTAVVLDAEGRVAYYGLALDREGSDLIPGIVAAVAKGEPIEGPSFRAPFG